MRYTYDQVFVTDQVTQDHRFKRIYTYDEGGEYPDTSWDDLVITPSAPDRRLCIAQVDVFSNEYSGTTIKISTPTQGDIWIRSMGQGGTLAVQVQSWYLFLAAPGDPVTLHFDMIDGNDPDYVDVRVGIREI